MKNSTHTRICLANYVMLCLCFLCVATQKRWHLLPATNSASHDLIGFFAFQTRSRVTRLTCRFRKKKCSGLQFAFGFNFMLAAWGLMKRNNMHCMCIYVYWSIPGGKKHSLETRRTSWFRPWPSSRPNPRQTRRQHAGQVNKNVRQKRATNRVEMLPVASKSRT